MTTRKYSSRSQQTTLTGALTSSGTSATVVSGSGLLGGVTISAGETFTVVINPDTAIEEIVDVTAVSGNTLTIVRGLDGSTGQAHSAGAVVRHMAIGRDYREANTHIENTTTAHGLTIANVLETTDTNMITTAMLQANAVTTAKITDANVTTAKIADSAITSAKIADLTIATGDIADSAITSGKIATGAVGTTKIDDLSVTEAKLASNSVTSAKIADGTIVAGDLADGAVTSAKILDGTIVNADVNSSAQIAYGKLALTNSVVNADIAAGAAIEWTKIAPSSTVSATELGYLDGVTSAVQTQLDSKLATSTAASTYAPLASPALTGVPTAPTATAGTNTTQVATTAFVKTAVDNIVDAAPGALDTLNELAAAMGDDPNFATTVTNSLATKLALSGGTMTGAIAMGTNKITGLGDPTNAQDAATKNYIDTTVVAPSNLTGPITSVGNVTSVAAQTGTGSTFVMQNSPTLTTPNIGVATATSVNGTTIPSSKTLVATDSTQYVVPSQTGNSGKYLTTDGTTSSWGAISGSLAQPTEPTSPTDGLIWVDTDGTTTDAAFVSRQTIDAKGDLIAGTANDTVDKLSVGSNGTFLVADSSASTGLAWTSTVSDATTTTAARGVGYMGIPQSSAATTGSYTIVAADAGEHIYSTATRTITIPANSSVAFPVGTAITFVANSGTTVTIAITSDTLILAGAGTTGSRTLSPHGMATALKITSTSWIISGNGLA